MARRKITGNKANATFVEAIDSHTGQLLGQVVEDRDRGRARVSMAVQIKNAQGKVTHARLVDVSPAGCGVVCDVLLEPKDMFRVVLRFSGEDGATNEIETEAVSQWCVADEDGYRAGLSLTDPSREDVERIDLLMRSNSQVNWLGRETAVKHHV